MLNIVLFFCFDFSCVLGCAGYTPSASVIAPQDLTICKKPDGSDFLLGQGTFGAVSTQ